MTYSHAKVQDQQSVSSEDRVETSERKDEGMDKAIALPAALVRSVTRDMSVSCTKLPILTSDETKTVRARPRQ